MRGFGLFLFGGLGSFGVAVSTAILRRIRSRSSQVCKIKHSDEEDVPNTHEVAVQWDGGALTGPTAPKTSLLKMLSAENRSDVTNASDVCAREYGENFYVDNSHVNNSPSRKSTVSGLSGATTETGPLSIEEYVDIMADADTESDDDFSGEYNAFQADEYNLESPQLSPLKTPRSESNSSDLHYATSPKSNSEKSENALQEKSEEALPSSQWAHFDENSNVSANENGTAFWSNDSPDVDQPGTEVVFPNEESQPASGEFPGLVEPEIEVQFETTVPALAPLTVDTASLVAPRPPPSAPFRLEENGVVTNAPALVTAPTTTKTAQTDIVAAPLSTAQVVDDPVSSGGVPTTAIDTATLPSSRTKGLAEVTGATVPRPIAAEGASTRSVVFAEKVEEVKENALSVEMGGKKKAREGMFGSRRFSRTEDERSTKRFRLPDRIRMRPLRNIWNTNK